MKVRELYSSLDKRIPRSLSCSWDNDGLMCCPNGAKEVKKVLIALDVTGAVVDYAVNNGYDVIISHHPFIFNGLKSLDDEGYISSKVIKVIESGISVMSFHTRLDACEGGVNDRLASLLELSDVSTVITDGIELGRIGYLKEPIEPEDFAKLVKELLGAPYVLLADAGVKTHKVAVVGGGNVAMDAARTALRLGAEKVYIVYRRSMEELPARREEVEHAEEEGIEFCLLCNPVEILGYNNPDDRRDPKNGTVVGMECIKMTLGEPDESGRRRPVAEKGSEFVLDVDCVIMSLGTSPNPLIKSTTSGLNTESWGGIIVDDNGLTSVEGVYAGGDAVTGAATVILAMGAGKTAAAGIDEYIKNKN